MDYTHTSAKLSDCGTYRYRLSRRWESDGSVCTFILLNPSTADGSQDDPTIRRCVGFADKWGHGGIDVVNLFAYRATDRSELKDASNPIGPSNDQHIIETIKDSERAVAAWGNDGSYLNRGSEVIEICEGHDVDLYAITLTKSGQPGHPLYLPKDSELTLIS